MNNNNLAEYYDTVLDLHLKVHKVQGVFEKSKNWIQFF